MGAVWAFYYFSLLVSEQNHSDIFLEPLGDALKRFNQMMDIFREDIMSQSAKASVDDHLPMKAHQLGKYQIDMIQAAL
jgi:hypothetical protein